MAVLAILLLISANVVSQVQRTWRNAAQRTSHFREAREAFEAMSNNLKQATLNQYEDYDNNSLASANNSTSSVPTRYLRRSDLHFVCGPTSSLLSGGTYSGQAVFFQMPAGVTFKAQYSGLNDLLCGRGYFVEINSDAGFRPPFVTKDRIRFRLMEFAPPTEQNLIYSVVDSNDTGTQRANKLKKWFAAAGGGVDVNNGVNRPVAENIILLVVSPQTGVFGQSVSDRVSIAPNYAFDSAMTANTSYADPQGTENTLPPVVRIALVAIDETTAEQLEIDGRSSDLLVAVKAGFTNAAKLSDDLSSLADTLVQQKIPFRIFERSVAIAGARDSS